MLRNFVECGFCESRCAVLQIPARTGEVRVSVTEIPNLNPMKLNSSSFLRIAAVVLLGMLMLPADLQAGHRTRYYGHHHHHHGHYYSYPRVGFGLSFGVPYYAPGYYSYGYARPYAYRTSRVYYGGGYYNRCYDVQRRLYRLGYYRGPIDGIYGPVTRGAVVRYRSGCGLGVAAVIDRPLLVHLGLW
jgi:hypothetical protein